MYGGGPNSRRGDDVACKQDCATNRVGFAATAHAITTASGWWCSIFAVLTTS